MCVVFGPQPVIDVQKKSFMWGSKVFAERDFHKQQQQRLRSLRMPSDTEQTDWIPSLGVGWVREILTSHSQPFSQLRAGSVRSRTDFCSCLNHVFLLPLSPYHASVCVRDMEPEGSSLPLYCFARQGVRGVSVTVFALLPHSLIQGTCCFLLAGLPMHFKK